MSVEGKLQGPTRWIKLTPADTVLTEAQLDGEQHARGIFQESTGNLAFYDQYGNVVSLKGLIGGVVHSIPNRGVLDTGTTATEVWVCF